jgi:Dimerisation domain
VNASRIPPAKLVRVIERVRHVLGIAHQRSAPPAGAMMEMILGAWRVQGISVAAELKVADALSDGPLTADDLARRVGADPDALARLMRALISEGIFKRRRDGRFALNALGETLRSDAPLSLAGMARMVGHPSYREHWSGLVDAVRTGEAYPPKLRGMGSWVWLETQPEFAAVFNDAMTSVSEFAVAPVVAAMTSHPSPPSSTSAAGTAGCFRRSSRQLPALAVCSTTSLRWSRAHRSCWRNTESPNESRSSEARSSMPPLPAATPM